MIASHNEHSVARAVELMATHGLPPNSAQVSFGQLLGMKDHVTFTLGQHGYRAYKYVPYGPVKEVVPYLIRRAEENSDVFGSVADEKRMISSEVWRRLTHSA